jgi:lipopolysaccharide/colanic/teichoic acid biosynthesis glycosyltransferase
MHVWGVRFGGRCIVGDYSKLDAAGATGVFRPLPPAVADNRKFLEERFRPSRTMDGGFSCPWCLSRGKRALDIVSALTLLALLSPILILVAVAIKLDSRGPVFYRQLRTGLNGRRFRMYKFRTMRKDADQLKESLRALNAHGPGSIDFKIKNDPRVTRVGRILRRLSVDEFPNLLSVLRGDMSLVGPRPTSFDVDVYADWHLARLAVPSGITGLWQISGRADVDFDERVKLDCRYIREQSLWLDLKIIAMTPFRVFSGRGAY